MDLRFSPEDEQYRQTLRTWLEVNRPQEFPPKDLRLGLIQASESKIGTLADQVVLYCYHYDPNTGKYSAIISRIIQLSGGLTILGIGAVLLLLFRRGSDYESRRQSGSHQYVR